MRVQLLAFTILAATFTTNAMAQAPAMTQSMSEKDGALRSSSPRMRCTAVTTVWASRSETSGTF